MKEILFHFFAALTLLPAFFVATSRNPVNAAMNMLASFVGLSALFVLLETYFLAILQVLVYAGAIVVLFLFIIMLIDPKKSPPPHLIRFLASLAAFTLLVFAGYFLVFGGGSGPFAQIAVESPASLSRTFGVALFTRYLLPFQITGFMLLIAMVGVIVVSRKDSSSAGGEA
ncbi:MAG TPA: NADH-quinone oxidoreductase subunit J [Oceanipulchritudo sp.]|nr:NADH-quinone oxidoreductase subunit J [Oceanipulchritudo sp.]